MQRRYEKEVDNMIEWLCRVSIYSTFARKLATRRGWRVNPLSTQRPRIPNDEILLQSGNQFSLPLTVRTCASIKYAIIHFAATVIINQTNLWNLLASPLRLRLFIRRIICKYRWNRVIECSRIKFCCDYFDWRAQRGSIAARSCFARERSGKRGLSIAFRFESRRIEAVLLKRMEEREMKHGSGETPKRRKEREQRNGEAEIKRGGVESNGGMVSWDAKWEGSAVGIKK